MRGIGRLMAHEKAAELFKRSPKSMRLIAAAVLTTDIASFERIGDFENSSAPRPRQGIC
jgi:hypothetical protein